MTTPEANPAATRDFLFEIGVEELPPKALRRLSEALVEQFRAGFGKAGLAHGEISPFAAPRRLALLVAGLAEKQPDRHIERFGPALAAAFDEAGAPTAAASGFARSCGVEVAELGRSKRQGVEKLCFTRLEAGTAAVELLPDLAASALAALPIPRRMRWGGSRAEFIRPVHWLVMLFGGEVVPATLFDVAAGNQTFGHRFHHNLPIVLAEPAEYAAKLAEPGRVIAEFARRREKIRDLVNAEAQRLDAVVAMDENLLDEVASLVEYPVALTGQFDPDFLELPSEVLVLTLKHHQKCFCLESRDGRIIPHFVTVSNLDSSEPGQVVRGNERVIRPRLADARFFYESDQSRSLEARLPELDKVVFQERLGTLGEKSRRVARLAGRLAEDLGFDPIPCGRAATLGKCDLVTDMVGEFAELQGLMGSYYARHDGETEAVATAIFEQYLPRHTGDRLPASPAGQTLALAEKLDTLAGLFAIGQPPTGSKDPFALRRAAIGVLRILIEGELDLDLSQAIDYALAFHSDLKPDAECGQRLFDFMLDRLRAWYAEAGVGASVYLCVRALRPPRPLDFHRRVEAVADFAGRPEAAALAQANKRVSNLLAKQGEAAAAAEFDLSLLREPAEKQLLAALRDAREAVAPLFAEGEYRKALVCLAGLREDVDRFFDEVMIMVDDPALRANRLRILRELRSLFLQAADISLL